MNMKKSNFSAYVFFLIYEITIVEMEMFLPLYGQNFK